MPKVIVVDDHAVIRRGVQAVLNAFPEWELCGEAENGQEKPEIVIMDVFMAGLNGLEASALSTTSCRIQRFFSLHCILPRSWCAAPSAPEHVVTS